MRRIAWMILVAACALVAACDKNTPLMDKVVAGDAAAVSALIAKGADVNARNNYGWTALSHAARAGNAELVKLLLAHGADVNARDQIRVDALDARGHEGPCGCGAGVAGTRRGGQ